MIVFDIETGPLPWHILEKIVPPFDEEQAVPHPGEFDQNNVAIGNLKDPVKIDAKIEEARFGHSLKVKSLAKARADARNKYVAGVMEKAALSAMTGQVKAIGIKDVDSSVSQIVAVDSVDFTTTVLGEISDQSYLYRTVPNEPILLATFWEAVKTRDGRFVGHNIHGFDLPFLIRRSWINGIDVPQGVMAGRYFAGKFVDTMQLWGCGGRDFVSLDAICKCLGVPGKGDDCSGADFARMFDEGGESRMKALAYLANDLEMTQAVAEAMGLI